MYSFLSLQLRDYEHGMLLCSVLSDYFGARSHLLHSQRCSITTSRPCFVSNVNVAVLAHSREFDSHALYDRILLVALARESESLGEWRDVLLRRASLERMLARSTADFSKQTPALTLKAVSASSTAPASSLTGGGNSSAFSFAALGWVVCAWSRRVLTMMHSLRGNSALPGRGIEASTDTVGSDSMEWLTCDMTSMYASDDESDDEAEESESQGSVGRSKAQPKTGTARRAAKSIIDDEDDDEESAANKLSNASSCISAAASTAGQSIEDRVRSVCLALVSQCFQPSTASSSGSSALAAPNPCTMSSWLTETHASFIRYVHDALRETRFAALEMAKAMTTAVQRSGAKSDMFDGLRATASSFGLPASFALASAGAASNSKSVSDGRTAASSLSVFSSADARRLVADSDSDQEARAGGYSGSDSDDNDEDADDDERDVDNDGDDDDREFGTNFRRALRENHSGASASSASSSSSSSSSATSSSSASLRNKWAAWLSRSWAKLDSELERLLDWSNAVADPFDAVLAEALRQVRMSTVSSSSSATSPLGPWSSISLARAPAVISWLRASVPIARPALLARADRRFRKWMVRNQALTSRCALPPLSSIF